MEWCLSTLIQICFLKSHLYTLHGEMLCMVNSYWGNGCCCGIYVQHHSLHHNRHVINYETVSNANCEMINYMYSSLVPATIATGLLYPHY